MRETRHKPFSTGRAHCSDIIIQNALQLDNIIEVSRSVGLQNRGFCWLTDLFSFPCASHLGKQLVIPDYSNYANL